MKDLTQEVLLVEDEAVSQTELTRALRREGFKVRQASTSLEAVKEAEAARPAVLLMDVILRDDEMDGIDVASKIQETHPFTSIIFVSAYAANSLYHKKIEQRQLRVSAWFEKPINLPDLIRTISREVKKAALRRDLANARARGIEPEVFLLNAAAKDSEIQPLIMGLLVERHQSTAAAPTGFASRPEEHAYSPEGIEGQLASAAALLGTFHELKNIFNHLALALSNIQEEVRLLGVAQSTSDRISSAIRGINRGAELVKIIFNAARTSTINEPTIIIDLDSICRKAVEDLEPMIVEKAMDVDIHSESEGDAHEQLKGYPDKILTAIRNVIQNAIEASPRLGRLSIGIGISQDSAIVRISDSGGGIPYLLRERIFEPYFSTKASEGSGLGLAIAKDIIERLHAGLIDVTSNEDIGSCFIITLPLQKL